MSERDRDELPESLTKEARGEARRPHEPDGDPRPAGQAPDEASPAPGPARSMAGPMGPAHSTELVGDPMGDEESGRAEGGAATGAAVGTVVGGPLGTAVGTIAGSVGGAVSPATDTEPGERDEPLGDPPAGEGTGPLDPIMRSTMSH